mgnify:CR=1 FL=1
MASCSDAEHGVVNRTVHHRTVYIFHTDTNHTVTETEPERIGRRDQFRALLRVAKYRPQFTAAIIIGGFAAALLESIGLSFILPVVEIVQGSGDPSQEADGIMQAFVSAYDFLGIPFTLGSVITGVSAVLTVRWLTTFLVRWLRSALAVDYTRHLQKRAFDSALDARIEYFDQEGSDDILNAIVTQADYAGGTIKSVIDFIEQGLIALMYLVISLIIAPFLTIFALAFLGGFTLLFRYGVVSGYQLGDAVADANERVQETAQSGTQGIRDTKLFGLKQELFEDFVDSIDQYARSNITLKRNQQAIQNFYNLLTAISVFVLIYVAITFADLSLSSLGVFLFAMFRLGPKASALNSKIYRIEGNLPHLVRTQDFIDELKRNSEPTNGTRPVPHTIDQIEVEDVRFSYDGQDGEALAGVSFEFEAGEFIAFVGESGAGKSTIVSLLVRMYEPDSGVIEANGQPIHEMDIDAWRSRIAVVRQDPFIFNDTLRYNLTIGNREASQSEIEQIADIARIDNFIGELPDGYETQLGDDGVRLSGGQRQRVALARALLKGADILILDEATSDLDSNLEKQVQEAIENMERDYAILGVAHRLSTVKNADQIHTVDSGAIVESGQHDELLEQGGQYAALYSIQSEDIS